MQAPGRKMNKGLGQGQHGCEYEVSLKMDEEKSHNINLFILKSHDINLFIEKSHNMNLFIQKSHNMNLFKEKSHRLMVEPEGHPADRDCHDTRNVNLKRKRNKLICYSLFEQ